MMRSMMYWKGMRRTNQSYVKSCRSCQVNKRHSQKYGHVPPKLVITTLGEALCVDLIGPYTLNHKDGSSVDFMCLTMIDPATSWFKMVELTKLQRETSGSKITNKNTEEADMTFDKSSAQISNLPDLTISLDKQPITLQKWGYNHLSSCNMDHMGIVSLALEGF
jgi:hypothetical protein